MDDCERCGSRIPWSYNARQTFCGCVTAHVCTKCATEFDRFMRQHKLWSDGLKVTARRNYYMSMAYAQKPVKESAWQTLENEENEIKMKMHAIVSDFFTPTEAVIKKMAEKEAYEAEMRKLEREKIIKRHLERKEKADAAQKTLS